MIRRPSTTVSTATEEATMFDKVIRAAAVAGLAAACTACASGGGSHSGFLGSYDGLAKRPGTVRATVYERRDEAMATAIERLWIAPAASHSDQMLSVEDEHRQAVLDEVDRQVCYELSKRFTLIDAPAPDAGTVKVGVTRIELTNQAGAAASAVANFFIPGPVSVRAPGGVGGLWAEAELLTPDGVQAAALVWSRQAMVLGADKPSLSPVGDAHQLAEPFGDAVAVALAPRDRKPRPVATPDPCARFGPRLRPEGLLVRMATGLYQPELSGAKPQARDARSADEPAPPR
ncbi:DUF3313 domain-containing protein [Caulobacter flavus]|uniref:DUF3313 domain-containing protein n=2 Tax=Caulobacter flavus TaxID=1679497 RepID=A0A2N5CPG9_9CAUL|nr:DUF3313 domain-containing protein [Caulobacter flavus]PLR08850.1 DUF3313 domain-containing protein [Caulobacter flavus]